MKEQVANIQNHCKVGGSTNELRKLIDALNVPTMWRVYVGSSRGTEIVPSVIGKYDTMRYGELQQFVTSNVQVGDTIEYKDRTLKVIVNNLAKGDALVPDTYHFIAIEEK